MLIQRPASARGLTRTDWLISHHTFSFGDYHDPAQMGFRTLRVINDDVIAAGSGFDTHGHRDMEIITVVLSGAVTHRDSLGHEAVIRAGDVQRMSAGTGVRHSEHNTSADDPAHFLQIWLLPRKPGLTPGYEQKTFGLTGTGVQHLVSGSGAPDTVTVNQDVEIRRLRLDAGQALSQPLPAGRHAFVQVITGPLEVGGMRLEAGDGLRASLEPNLAFTASDGPADALIFDLG